MKKKTSLLSMILMGAFVFGNNTYGLPEKEDQKEKAEQSFSDGLFVDSGDMTKWVINISDIENLLGALAGFEELGGPSAMMVKLNKQLSFVADQRDAQIPEENAMRLKKEGLEKDVQSLGKDISSLKGKIQDNKNAMAGINQRIASDQTVYNKLLNENFELEAQADQKLMEYSNHLDALRQAQKEYHDLLRNIKKVNGELDRNLLEIFDVVKSTPTKINNLKVQQDQLLTRLTNLMKNLQKERGVITVLQEKNKKDMKAFAALGNKFNVNKARSNKALNKLQADLQNRYNEKQIISSEEKKLTQEEGERTLDEAALGNTKQSSTPSKKPSGSISRPKLIITNHTTQSTPRSTHTKDSKTLKD